MDLFPAPHLDLARRLLAACEAAGLRLVTAESCTGGLIAGCLTEIAGSSAVVERGYVVYSNEAKQEMLGVPAELLRQHGAVSEPVARAMAEGALARSGCGLALAVTGIAGPGGATAGKASWAGPSWQRRRRGSLPCIERRSSQAIGRRSGCATVEAAMLLGLSPALGAALSRRVPGLARSSTSCRAARSSSV